MSTFLGKDHDKSNVRFILQYDLPKNIESYYQEIGRAGRDGMKAECALFFSYGDIHKIRYFIEQKEGLEKRAANLQLGTMHIIGVLRGSKSAKVFKFGCHKLSTYGIGTDLSQRQWLQVSRQLLHKGFMAQDFEIGGLSLLPRAWDVFKGKETVFGRLDEADEPERKVDESRQYPEAEEADQE